MLAWYFDSNNDLYEGFEIKTTSPPVIGGEVLYATSTLIEGIRRGSGTLLAQVEIDFDSLKHGASYCVSSMVVRHLAEISLLLEAAYQKLIFSLLSKEEQSIQNVLNSFIDLIKYKRLYLRNKITLIQFLELEVRKWKDFITLRSSFDRRTELLALWCMRTGLIEENSNKRNKPIILGTLCSWLLESQNLSDGEIWRDKLEKILFELVKKHCVEFEFQSQ